MLNNVCGEKNKELQLSDRVWTCSNCGTEHDRDKNAGINLQKEGLKILGLGQTNVEKMSDLDFSKSEKSSMKQEALAL